MEKKIAYYGADPNGTPAVKPKPTVADSGENPSAEVRLQYEIIFDELRSDEISVRAYFLSDSRDGRVEWQNLLRGKSSIRVNGKPMKEVVNERIPPKDPVEGKAIEVDSSDRAFYERKLPSSVKQITFDFVALDGKLYRNRVPFPPLAMSTDLTVPIVRGEGFRLSFKGVEGMKNDTSLSALLGDLTFLQANKNDLKTLIAELENDKEKTL